MAPFGGRFANGALSSVYVVAEAAGGTVSSYRYATDGSFAGITGPLAVAGQMAPCWLAITPDNQFVYVSNGSGSVSLFSLDANGTIAAVNPTAAQEPAVGSNASFAADSWISPDGKYLYQNYAGADKIVSYAIAANGALTKLDDGPSALHPKSACRAWSATRIVRGKGVETLPGIATVLRLAGPLPAHLAMSPGHKKVFISQQSVQVDVLFIPQHHPSGLAGWRAG